MPAPVPRRLSSARGPLDLLLTDPGLSAQEDDWLSITVTDTARPESAMERLSARFPHVLVLAHEPEGLVRTSESYATRVSGRTDLEIAGSFVSHVRGTPASSAELALLGAAFEGVRA